MRRTVVVLAIALAAGGCHRRRHVAIEAPVRPPAPAPVTAPEEPVVERHAPAPFVFPTATAPSDGGLGPSDDEIRRVLAPVWPELGRCIAGLLTDGGAGPLGLRFTIAPSGVPVGDAVLDGLPAASACVRDRLAPLRFEPFRDRPVGIAIAIGTDGQPLPGRPTTVDAGH